MGYEYGGWIEKYAIYKVAAKCRGCDDVEHNRDEQCPILMPVDQGAIYFPLRIDTDPHAVAAILVYADSVEVTNSQLAEDIRTKVNSIAEHFEETLKDKNECGNDEKCVSCKDFRGCICGI
jgi:hypothetical protein